MASDLEFVTYILDQCDPDLQVTHRKMFGEYGLWSQETFIGVVCDDTLFLKPTEGARTYLGEVVEAPPYPGAKPSFLIGDRLDDGAWLSELIRITAAELRDPMPKAPTRKKPGKTEG
jgi:TfoX/Sxy family transcriptional regulator of competence genes